MDYDSSRMPGGFWSLRRRDAATETRIILRNTEYFTIHD